MRSSRYAVAALLTLAAAGCARGPEQALLSQFFAASRLRDLTALQKIASVVFEPTRDGVVTSFDITGIAAKGSDAEEVMVAAPVRLPDGRTVSKRLVVTIQRGRISAISERPALGPVEGPASPSPPPR